MCALMLSGTSGQEMRGMDIVHASGVAWAPGPVANLHHEVTRQRASIQKDKHNLAVERKTLQSSMIYFVGGRLPHYMGQPCRGIDNYITIIVIITIIVKSILMHRFPTYSPIRGKSSRKELPMLQDFRAIPRAWFCSFSLRIRVSGYSHLIMNDDLHFLSITCMPQTSQVVPRPARLTGYPTGFGKWCPPEVRPQLGQSGGPPDWLLDQPWSTQNHVRLIFFDEWFSHSFRNPSDIHIHKNMVLLVYSIYIFPHYRLQLGFNTNRCSPGYPLADGAARVLARAPNLDTIAGLWMARTIW